MVFNDIDAIPLVVIELANARERQLTQTDSEQPSIDAIALECSSGSSQQAIIDGHLKELLDDDRDAQDLDAVEQAVRHSRAVLERPTTSAVVAREPDWVGQCPYCGRANPENYGSCDPVYPRMCQDEPP